MLFSKILFPIDPSQESQQAIDMVLTFAESFQSHLLLLSVVEVGDGLGANSSGVNSSGAGSSGAGSSGAGGGVMHSPEAVAEFLHRAKGLFAERGLTAETLEREGQPAFVICDVADEVGADLIIMGCRGMGLTEEGLSDSVTNRVINLAPCPVLVVP